MQFSVISNMNNILIDLYHLVSDNIEAVYDVWFVGDQFLQDIYSTFQAMINRATLDKRAWQPYLLEYYNPKGYFFTSKGWLNSSTSRVLNKLIEALNENSRLPKMIIFIIDKDFITDVKNYDYGATRNLANLVNWFMRQCDIVVQRKMLQISEKKPGALTASHPTLIFANMIRTAERYPLGSKFASICSL